MTTHQSRTSVWPHDQFERDVAAQLDDDERHRAADVTLPPYYPDTSTVRRGMARYYDCICAMDKQVGQILAELEEDGLADDTIVFFFSDHGMGMPRGKRLLHDSGMHVPLMVRIPEAFRDLRSAAEGEVDKQIVSFVDFAPTVLRLAKLDVPSWMQGKHFLGADVEPREYAYGARDRVDEVDDLSRSVRDQRYLYIRNYMPHLSWMQPEWYSDNSDLRRELFALRDAGQLNTTQLTYAAPVKPVEELYDTSNDSFQTRNLAQDSQFREILDRMRMAHRQWVIDTRDIGFLPESDVWARLQNDTPWDVAQDDDRYPLTRIFSAAQDVGVRTNPSRQAQWSSDTDSAVRFWGILGRCSQGEPFEQSQRIFSASLADSSPAVRIEAAAGLLSVGESPAATNVLIDAINGENVDVMLRAIRTLQLYRQTAKPNREQIETLLRRAEMGEASAVHPCWMFVRFSADALLNR